MLWTRRVLLVVWVLLLIAQVPSIVQQAWSIYGGMAPGPEQSLAIRELVWSAITTLILIPFFLFAILGYGIRVRPASSVWSIGGPWFDTWWRPGRRRKARSKDGHQ